MSLIQIATLLVIVGVCGANPQRTNSNRQQLTINAIPRPQQPSGLYGTPSTEPPVKTTTTVVPKFETPKPIRPDEGPEGDEQDISIIKLRTPRPTEEKFTEQPPPMMMLMPYNFDWVVDDSKSSNTFSHVESSDGQRMEGEYKVLQPDGRMRVVKYFDDGNGLNAEVTYT